MQKEQIRNRILSSENVSPKDVKKNVLNFRKHPKKQRDALAATLQRIGWIQDVIVNKRTNTLIDGHLRLQIAIDNKEETIPVKYVDLDESEEKLALATFDPISALAETEKQALDSLLRELPDALPVEIQQLLSDLAEDAGLIAEEAKEEDLSSDYNQEYKIVVTCKDDTDQAELLQRLEAEGYKCQLLML